MKRLTLSILLIISTFTLHAQEETFWLGADISGTTAMEALGQRLYNAKGEVRECTALMHELGLNAVRLRVWVNPRHSFSSKEDVLQMALRAKYYGMALMIDFHYSDWWADPAKQHIPAAWQYYNYGEMCEVLADHTRETLQLLKKHGVDVHWVQIGNETTHGFLWPMGRAEENMEQYAGLTEAGYRAVKQVYPDAQCIVHIDCGCDLKRYEFIFDGLEKYGTQYDMIGMSVYPYWDREAGLTQTDEETLQRVVQNINTLYNKYKRPLLITETGVDLREPAKGKKFLKNLFKALRTQCGGHCNGAFYWAPEMEGGAYWLGAFKDHKPTIIMDAFTEEAKVKQ